MSYVEKNLVPGEALLYQTRHHWIVLIGALLIALLVGLPGLFLLFEVAAKRPEIYYYVTRMLAGAETLVVAGGVMVVFWLAILGCGVTKRNATEMAVTNRRVLIK